jgi:hypothetical protein
VLVMRDVTALHESAAALRESEDHYRHAVEFNQGFWLMLRACDRIYLLTGPGGTTVVLEQGRLEPELPWALTPT